MWERVVAEAIAQAFAFFDSGPHGARDRYTVVAIVARGGDIYYLALDAHPYRASGSMLRGSFPVQVWERAGGKHFGTRIELKDLPAEARRAALVFMAEMSEK